MPPWGLTRLRRVTIKLVREACLVGDVRKACPAWGGLEAEKKTRGEPAKKIEKLRHYLLKNESGLKDYRLDLGEEGIRLRRMEGNVDKLVVRPA